MKKLILLSVVMMVFIYGSKSFAQSERLVGEHGRYKGRISAEITHSITGEKTTLTRPWFESYNVYLTATSHNAKQICNAFGLDYIYGSMKTTKDAYNEVAKVMWGLENGFFIIELHRLPLSEVSPDQSFITSLDCSVDNN